MCGTYDVGKQIEEEGDDDCDMIDFEKEDFASVSLWGLLWDVVEHLDTATRWVCKVVPVDLLFGLKTSFAVGHSCFGATTEVFHFLGLNYVFGLAEFPCLDL